MAEPPSSPPGESASSEDALSWYKAQYEQLESELAEFRESSKELEQELEKDIERAEKQERVLQERAEALGFECEEWKRKYKESKSEANAAQSVLEKEITTLRESSRALQLKLRDIEVANDDFERQARNTTSSLEDLEQKYNQAIERAVMMEEDIKIGEQEREKLRIEAQRLKEEYSDLKIEADVLQDKLRKQEARHLSTISTDLSALGSPTFDKNTEGDADSTASSPLITSPPEEKSLSELEVHDPPSPPMSDASVPLPRRNTTINKTPAAGQRKSRLPSMEHSATPKPKMPTGTGSRSGASRLSAGGVALRTPANRAVRPTNHKLPASNSLSHIRSLTAQMQRLEARVQSARSKLPAPTHTPPRASPRGAHGLPNIPSSVTLRSRRRGAGSTASSSVAGDETTPTTGMPSTVPKNGHMPRLSTSGISRLSFGPLPNRNPDADLSRPSSRTSMSSYARPPSRTEMAPPRPMSRTSMPGSRTPLRPRSSMSGSIHGHSLSMSRIEFDEADEGDEDAGELRTPSRRGTYSKYDIEGGVQSGIPMPGRRMSGGGQSGIPMPGRRPSTGRISVASSRPGTATGHMKLSDLGETY